MTARHRLAHYLQLWALRADGAPLHTPAACLLPVLYGDQPAMLKLSTGDDERRAGALLRWWDGDGAVRVLAASPDDDVLLLERVISLRSLARLACLDEAGDEAATRILCVVAARLHAQRPSALPLPPLSGYFVALDAAAAHGGVFAACHAVAQDLLAAPQLLEQVAAACRSAGWFWQSRGLNRLADAGDLERLTRRINGGLNGHIKHLTWNQFFHFIHQSNTTMTRIIAMTNHRQSIYFITVNQYIDFD